MLNKNWKHKNQLLPRPCCATSTTWRVTTMCGRRKTSTCWKASSCWPRRSPCVWTPRPPSFSWPTGSSTTATSSTLHSSRGEGVLLGILEFMQWTKLCVFSALTVVRIKIIWYEHDFLAPPIFRGGGGAWFVLVCLSVRLFIAQSFCCK